VVEAELSDIEPVGGVSDGIVEDWRLSVFARPLAHTEGLVPAAVVLKLQFVSDGELVAEMNLLPDQALALAELVKVAAGRVAGGPPA
jgi:hypothetical protein